MRKGFVAASLRALRSSSLLHFSQACYSPRQCRPGRISVSTRAFELGIGALLAVTWPSIEGWAPTRRAVLGWFGIVGIIISVPLASSVSEFPGWVAAVPVLSTAAVISGGNSVRFGAVVILRVRLLQWVGERSYSLYLWHWPVLVLAAAALGRPLAWYEIAVALPSCSCHLSTRLSLHRTSVTAIAAAHRAAHLKLCAWGRSSRRHCAHRGDHLSLPARHFYRCHRPSAVD